MIVIVELLRRSPELGTVQFFQTSSPAMTLGLQQFCDQCSCKSSLAAMDKQLTFIQLKIVPNRNSLHSVNIFQKAIIFCNLSSLSIDAFKFSTKKNEKSNFRHIKVLDVFGVYKFCNHLAL